MKMPIILHGQQAEVRKRCLRVVRELARGERYLDAMGDTRDADLLPGNLVIEGGRGTLGSELHLHCYLVTHNIYAAVVAKKLAKRVAEDVVQASLGSAWGLTTLLGGSGEGLMLRGASAATFLRAVLVHWEELISVGPRYSFHGLPATELWQLPSAIHVALGKVGIPLARLRRGLTREGIAPFEAYLRSA